MSKKFSKNTSKAEKVIEKIIGGGSYVDYEYDYSKPDFFASGAQFILKRVTS